MQLLFQQLPMLLELFINGGFVILFALKSMDKIPLGPDPAIVDSLLELGARSIPMVLFFILVVTYLNSEKFDDFIRRHVFSIIIFFPLVLTWGDQEFCFWFASVHLLSSIFITWRTIPSGKKKRIVPMLGVFRLQAAQIVMLTFIGLIGFGTSLLMLPISSATGKAFGFMDAVFMATSATCVTGLSTLSLTDQFSFFGQMVMLVLIQVGGLGIMILYASMTILLGRSMPMAERIIMQDLLSISSLEELINTIIDIIKYTFIIELWGAVFLTVAFSLEGYEFGKAIYFGFFHSISAFCNAGFSLFDNSLESFGTKPLIHGTIAGLITLGGLGFIVIREIKYAIKTKRSFARLGLHTKIVLITSIVLIMSGTIIIFFGEFLNALDGFSFWEKLQIAFFQSVTLRTAGFNTIPLTNLHTHTIYLMSMFMFIGASPGSTGGGIKTSAFAILIQSIRSTLNGRDRVEIFDRTIPNSLVVKTTALTIISIITATLFIFVLMKIESDQTFLSIFFEAISASATVGLSLGITPYLSALGKLAIVILMFIGRVGPLTLVLAVGSQEKVVGRFDYPDGRVMIG